MIARGKLWLGLMVLTLAFACPGTAIAVEVSLGNGGGPPGSIVTILLNIDDAPVDAQGLFSLDLEVQFDDSLFSLNAVRAGGVFDTDEFLGTVVGAGLTLPLTSSPPTLIMLGSFVDNGTPVPPGGGTLVELDFAILGLALPGPPSPLGLTFNDPNDPATAGISLQGGQLAVTAIPLPAGVWLLVAALCGMFGITRAKKINPLKPV